MARFTYKSILPWLILLALPGWLGDDWSGPHFKRHTEAPLRREADCTAHGARYTDLRKTKQGYHGDALAKGFKTL